MKTMETDREVVSGAEWLVARKDLLAREKELIRQRDALSAARRSLPMVKVDQNYVFDGANGKEALADLFEGRSQLIVYHFMLGPDWEEGCKSCSYLADHFDGANWHLPHRDVTLVVISRAPFSKLEAYKKRMGWRFKWLSSEKNGFNFDYHVSFTAQDEKNNKAYYNYATGEFLSDELPGLSVFYKNENGDVFHTYSTYSRGLDMLVGAYNFLDLTPKGRDEEPDATMSWVRRHDEY
ncbi:MAG TPA: thioredoxin family protein [Chthoniobacterales bacterium]|nr:thioredoxin family protein [Chthoniobacterales bacterium]